MIATTAIEVSRNWSSTLSRFGFGVLFLAGISYLGLLPSVLDFRVNSDLELDFSLLPSFVLWIVLSMVVGSVAISIGSLGEGSRFGEEAKARRAYRVGKSGNSLLAEYLREANSKFEVASGLLGVIYLLIIAFFVLWTSGLRPITFSEIPDAELVNTGRLTAVFGAAGGLTSLWIKSNSKASIEALEKILDEFFPEVKDGGST